MPTRTAILPCNAEGEDFHRCIVRKQWDKDTSLWIGKQDQLFEIVASASVKKLNFEPPIEITLALLWDMNGPTVQLYIRKG